MMQGFNLYGVEKEKETGLSALEKDELDHFIVLERAIRLAKARVRLA